MQVARKDLYNGTIARELRTEVEVGIGWIGIINAFIMKPLSRLLIECTVNEEVSFYRYFRRGLETFLVNGNGDIMPLCVVNFTKINLANNFTWLL